MRPNPNNLAISQREKGTYVLSQFNAQKLELSRLQKQASILPNLEREVLEKSGLKPGMQVLDAACGPGIVSSLLAQTVQQDGSSGTVLGVDQDEKLLRIARGLAMERRQEIAFVQGDVYTLPYQSAFDYAYCRFLFQHLNDPVAALSSLYQTLRPGGIVHILDVNDEWLFLEPPVAAFETLKEQACEVQRQKGGDRHIGRHLRHHLHAAGYEQVQLAVEVVHSDMIGMANFLELSTRFKFELLKGHAAETAQELEKGLSLEQLPPDAFGAVGLFSVTARKPF